MKGKSYKNPLSRNIFAGSVIFLVVICTVIVSISYTFFNRTMMNYYKSHLTDIINLTLSNIDIEDLEQCIKTKEKSEKFEELTVFLDKVRQNYTLESIIIVHPVKNGDTYDAMQVLSGLYADERQGVAKKDFPAPMFGDMMGHFFSQEFLSQIYSDMMNRRDVKFSTSNSDFGRTYDVTLSIRNKNGEGFALLSSSITLQQIDSTMHNYLITTILTAVALGTIFLVSILLWMQKRVIRPLQTIEQSATEFAEKTKGKNSEVEFVLELPELHTGDELESLSNTLVSMSQSMKEYVLALIDSKLKMADMKQTVSKISTIAYHDSLTGVKSKAAYDKEKERLDWDIVNDVADFALLMVDLNYLKRVNDEYGHEKGDLYIKNACSVICDIFDHSPVYRIGGDEFLVVLENRDLKSREELVLRLKNQIEQLRNNKNLEAWNRVSAAVGLSVFDKNLDSNVDTVFKRADKFMYENKKEMKAVRTD